MHLGFLYPVTVPTFAPRYALRRPSSEKTVVRGGGPAVLPPPCRKCGWCAAVPTSGRPWMSEVSHGCCGSDAWTPPDVGSVARVLRFRRLDAPGCRKCGWYAAVPTPGRPRMSEVWREYNETDAQRDKSVGSVARVLRFRRLDAPGCRKCGAGTTKPTPGVARMSGVRHGCCEPDTWRGKNVGSAARTPHSRHSADSGDVALCPS